MCPTGLQKSSVHTFSLERLQITKIIIKNWKIFFSKRKRNDGEIIFDYFCTAVAAQNYWFCIIPEAQQVEYDTSNTNAYIY